MSTAIAAAGLLVAGGNGSRLGVSGGKQMLRVGGRPLFVWAAEALDAAPEIALLVLVCPSARSDEYAEALRSAAIKTPWILAASGMTRQESVFSGLSAVPASFDVVAVHDGARPLVASALISAAVSQIERNSGLDGVVVGHPSIDTLKMVEDGYVTDTLERSRVWSVQTPQVFRREALVRAHAAALSAGFAGTDDAVLVERIGGAVAVIEGPRDNLKVTVPEDVAIAEAIIARRALGREDSA